MEMTERNDGRDDVFREMNGVSTAERRGGGVARAVPEGARVA